MICFVDCRRKTTGPSKAGGVTVETAGVAVGRTAKWSVQRVSAGQGVARGLRGLMQLRRTPPTSKDDFVVNEATDGQASLVHRFV